MPVFMCKFRAVIAFLVVALPLSAIAQSIEIKGLHVGMTRAEVQATFPPGTDFDFTIAGVPGKYEYTPLDLRFRDDKLDGFIFLFNPSGFGAVLGAIKEKYPETVCKSTKVQNAMGATFEQIRCSLEDKESILELTRYVDIRTSALHLMSKKFAEEQVEKAKQRMKDL